MCFEFYNITSYPGKRCLQEYMNVCITQEVLYCPCNTLQPAVCAVIHLNAIILKKWTIKKRQFKENGVKKS